MLCGAAVLAGLLAVGTRAPQAVSAERSVVIERRGAPAGDAELVARVARMREILDDAGARFSASAAVGELKVLRAFAGARPDLLPRRREILSMIGAVVSRARLMDAADGLEALAELMRLADGDDRPIRRRMLDHQAYAKLAADDAATPGHAASHALAADQYGQAAALADGLPDADDRRAALRERQGYELHEAGRHGEALAVNLRVLAVGERLYGPRDPKLRVVLTNLAQNLYALGRKAEAAPFLVRVQRIAEAQGEVKVAGDMLFQRGVLAFELDRPDEARALMRERIDRLQAAHETELLATAREDYEELERRIAGR